MPSHLIVGSRPRGGGSNSLRRRFPQTDVGAHFYIHNIKFLVNRSVKRIDGAFSFSLPTRCVAASDAASCSNESKGSENPINAKRRPRALARRHGKPSPTGLERWKAKELPGVQRSIWPRTKYSRHRAIIRSTLVINREGQLQPSIICFRPYFRIGVVYANYLQCVSPKNCSRFLPLLHHFLL